MIKCPVCNGTGEINADELISSVTRYSDEELYAAYKLRKAGLTLMGVGKLLGINHPQKVQHMVSQYEQRIKDQKEYTPTDPEREKNG